MRKILMLICFLGLLSSPFAYSVEIKVDSKISAVTIYTAGALVKRVAQVKLNQGENRVIFPEIIPEIDEDSLRVSGEGPASVKILGASVKKEFLKEEPVKRIRELEEEIQKLEDKLGQLQDTKSRLSDQKASSGWGKVILFSTNTQRFSYQDTLGRGFK